MKHRALVLFGLAWLAGSMAAWGQAPPTAWKAPRTADGKPDLQGIWTNGFATPFERPKDMANKPFFSAEEAAAFEKAVSERGEPANDPVADPTIWWERGTKLGRTRRTSVVIDPPDGRLPPLTPEAQKRMADARAETRRHPDSGPEDRSLMERCIVSPVGGPVPMLPGPYNNNYQIVQTPGYAIIVVEMIHDVRIIPIDGEPLKPGVPQWLGQSRGHWEGETLVVDTINFTDRTRFRGTDEKLHLIERFTRTAPDMLVYQFTVDDPTAYTKPWTGEIPMLTSDGRMYEFSCHEGNAAMMNMLNTARLAEKAAGKLKVTEPR